MSHDLVLIVDFGSQVTQLIARRVREAGVYCEIHPFSKAAEAFARLKPRAVILSGGPSSVPVAGSPRAPMEIFKSGVPILAICYGQQTLCEQLGGKVESGHAAEFGRADVEVLAPSRPVRRGVAARRALSGVDEPRRPRDPAARRFPRLCGVGECALRRRRRRNAPLLHDDVSSRGGPHPRRRETHRQFPVQDRRPQRRLDDGEVPRRGDRPYPRAGRQGPRDLRPVGRRRFRGRGGADSRGDRRSAHLRVRRPRASAARRGGRSGQPVSRPFQHPARSCRRG